MVVCDVNDLSLSSASSGCTMLSMASIGSHSRESISLVLLDSGVTGCRFNGSMCGRTVAGPIESLSSPGLLGISCPCDLLLCN